MSSGGLLLLLGLLTLWAELTPIYVQGRPELCYLPVDTGPCEAKTSRFYYNSASNKCEEFPYGGCEGNANNFETKHKCHYTCIEKPGVCPSNPPGVITICLVNCENDWICTGKQKCCPYGCLYDCSDPA